GSSWTDPSSALARASEHPIGASRRLPTMPSSPSTQAWRTTPGWYGRLIEHAIGRRRQALHGDCATPHKQTHLSFQCGASRPAPARETVMKGIHLNIAAAALSFVLPP